jgi:hypothetical protein
MRAPPEEALRAMACSENQGIPTKTELPEFACDKLESAWIHFGKIALAFDTVVIVLGPKCARAVDDMLCELTEIDEAE